MQLKEKDHLEFDDGRILNVTVVDIGMVEAYASGLGEFYVDQINADTILINHIDADGRRTRRDCGRLEGAEKTEYEGFEK